MRRLTAFAGGMTLWMWAATAFGATPKDTVVMAKQIDDIISLDPAEAFEFSGSEVVANLYDRLLGHDVKDVRRLEGDLAESWSVAEDGKTYTFKLRPNSCRWCSRIRSGRCIRDTPWIGS